MPPDLALLSTLIGSNYPRLELFFMVPKVFEPLKFDCIFFLRYADLVTLSIHVLHLLLDDRCKGQQVSKTMLIMMSMKFVIFFFNVFVSFLVYVCSVMVQIRVGSSGDWKTIYQPSSKWVYVPVSNQVRQ